MGITSSAAVVGGTLYVGGGDSGWYALDAATGKVQWMVSAIPAGQQPDGYYNYASPLILGNFAYVGIASSGNCPSTVGALLRVDLTQHAVVGEWDPLPAGQVGGPIWSSPAADPSGATLYVATGEGDAGDYTTQPYTLAIVALDATTLAVTGSFQIPQSDFVTDPDFGASPSVFDDSNGRHLVACANKDGWIYALDRTTMQLAWKVHLDAGGGDPITGEGSISSAAVAGSMVYVGAGSSSVMGQSFEGAVTAIDAATGKVAWAHGAPGVVMGPITFANGLVFYGTGSTSNGVSAAVEVLDAASGNALFTAMLGPPAAANFVSSSVTVSGGRLFFGHGNGTIYAYGL
jgi:outer membrane protein assembly factor BamB